jgi:hypothetical protein
LCITSTPRIFLGDVGSIPLGFLAGALGLVGWRNDAWPLWFPVLVFGPFIGDATVTLLRRLVRGDKVWKAHREHYYQRMVLMGLGHRRTAWMAYIVMGVCAAVALLGRSQAPWLQASFFGAAPIKAAGVDLPGRFGSGRQRKHAPRRLRARDRGGWRGGRVLAALQLRHAGRVPAACCSCCLGGRGPAVVFLALRLYRAVALREPADLSA